MTILISPNSGKLWILLGLISFSVFTPVWIVTNCVYHPEDLGRLRRLCGGSHEPETNHTPPRKKRSVTPTDSLPQQVAITQIGGDPIFETYGDKSYFVNVKGATTTFWFNSSSTEVATYKFNHSLCDRVAVPFRSQAYICVIDDYWGSKCGNWESVGWNTGTAWGYKPQSALDRRDKNGRSLLDRMTLTKQDTTILHPYPFALIRGYTDNLQLILNIENPSKSDEGSYILGVYWPSGGSEPPCEFHLKDMHNSEEWNVLSKPSSLSQSSSNPLKPHLHSFKDMTAIADPTFEDTMAIETGFSDVNLWLEWMKYNADKHNKSNCYVCGRARPHLGTVPIHIPEDQEECFFSLFTNTVSNDSSCEKWKKEYPILSKNPNPGDGITIYPGNYTCYVSNSTRGKNLKTFPPGYCAEYRTTVVVNQTRSLGDIYWICGDMKIRGKLESAWKGECALAKVIMPLHILAEGSPVETEHHSRRKRSAPIGSFDPHVYIDAIGVPRGVPDEFKARDQVAAGFESILPIISVNKNVDWINYIYYNQQRFVNYTRDALKGIAEQLEATSQMTFQNRMALDMILAEKGGTCKYIDRVDACCTYIPDNTGPNGKVTLAIKKLEDLSEELKKNSGLANPWDQYFGWFTSWKQALVQLAIIIIVILIIIGIVVCCVIPCFKKMLSKGIDNMSMYSSSPHEQTTPLVTGQVSYAEYVRRHRQCKKKNLVI